MFGNTIEMLNNQDVPAEVSPETLYDRPNDRRINKLSEELKSLPEVSANFKKIVETFDNIGTAIQKGDEQCKKVLDDHEKQFLLAYRVPRSNTVDTHVECVQGDRGFAAEDKRCGGEDVEGNAQVQGGGGLEVLQGGDAAAFEDLQGEGGRDRYFGRWKIERLKKLAETKEFDKKFIEMQIEKKQKKIATLKTSVENTTSLFQKLIKNCPEKGKPLVKLHQKITPADYNKGIEEFMIKLMESGASDDEIVGEVGKYMQQYSAEVERQVRHLRSELEYEKLKQQQAQKTFLDQITSRSELETFFLECLGEMRKEILHKGPKELVQDPGEGDGKMDANRYQALKSVLSNERILITLFDEIFGPPVKRQEESLLPNLAGESRIKLQDSDINFGNISSQL